MDNKKYYTALGQLVYAVAIADGTIHNEETAKVFHFVVSQFLNHEPETINDRSGLEAFYTEKEFNRLREKNVTCDVALRQFEEFYTKNRNQFDEKMKDMCINIIEGIANAHNGVDNCELEIIDRIRSLFVEK